MREIEGLDPLRDAERIVYLHACFEFPFDVARSAGTGLLPHVRCPVDRRATRLQLHVSRGLAERLGGTLTYGRDGDITIFELRLPTRID